MTIEEMKKKKTERGLTYEQIAAMSGVPLGTVQKVFGGMTRAPRYDTIRTLEKFFAQTDDASTGAQTVCMDEHKLSFMQQRIVAELFSQIKNYLDAHEIKNAVPLMASADVRLDCGGQTVVLRPDLMIVCDPDQIKGWGILGAPDFAAEIYSPPARRRDGYIKLEKYALSGVREYWMIDTEEKKLIVYPLEQDACLKVFKLDGRVPLGIFPDLLIDLKRISELIHEDPEK